MGGGKLCFCVGGHGMGRDMTLSIKFGNEALGRMAGWGFSH